MLRVSATGACCSAAVPPYPDRWRGQRRRPPGSLRHHWWVHLLAVVSSPVSGDTAFLMVYDVFMAVAI